MKRALVCGAGGFIGHHLVKRLKKEGYWVRGVDIKKPEFSESEADEFLILDIRYLGHCVTAANDIDIIYQLAANMGGMGFIHSAECEIMRDSALININMIEAAYREKVKKYFFSSSACVYRDQKIGEKELKEDDAYPSFPDNEYGWEKLYAERMALAYGRNRGIDVKIARFQNTYGPEGTWEGGREKAPAAICRKVAEVKDGGEIEVWGDGTALRSYTYIDDLIDGIRALVESDIKEPTNIGWPTYYSVNDLVKTVSKVAGKNIKIKYIEGPVGVQARYFSNERIYSTGWKPKWSLEEGIKITYPWVKEKVEIKRNN